MQPLYNWMCQYSCITQTYANVNVTTIKKTPFFFIVVYFCVISKATGFIAVKQKKSEKINKRVTSVFKLSPKYSLFVSKKQRSNYPLRNTHKLK